MSIDEIIRGTRRVSNRKEQRQRMEGTKERNRKARWREIGRNEGEK